LVYTRAVGKYGQIENSFAVVGITQAEAEMLGRKYDQDSVLTREGLTYQDGSVNPATGEVENFAERPDDFFTEIPKVGVQFAVGINFDVKISPTTGVAGWTPERIDALIENAKPGQYAVMMSPDDFLGLTLSAKGRAVVEQRVAELPEYGTLDPAQMKPIGVSIQTRGEPSDYQKSIGVTALDAMTMAHDGRHRAMMAKRAGVTLMPVVVTSNTPINRGLVLTPQRSRDKLANGDTPFTFGDAVEINAENRKQLLDMAKPATILYQSENPIFYSALARAIEASKQVKAPASQWKGVLQTTPGVKAEELEWSGLLEMLDFDPKAVFTKEELAAAVEAGGIKIEERVLGEKLSGGAWLDAVEEETESRLNLMADELEEREGDWFSRADYISENWGGVQEAVERDMEAERPDTQFDSWSSDPNNDTYRELLLTLPIGQGGNPERAPSTHWGQPAVVAHVRFMDKEDVDRNRVLFVEEVQSDWHQKGRDQGYEAAVDLKVVEAASAKRDKAREELSEAAEAFRPVLQNVQAAVRSDFAPDDPTDLRVTPSQKAFDDQYVDDIFTRPNAAGMWPDVVEMIDRYQTLSNIGAGYDPLLRFPEAHVFFRALTAAREAYDLAGRELDIAKGLITNGGVPNAPFKTSWPALVMKRVIKYAVDGGYDKVAWTTGEQQAERYNLSRSVGAIEAAKVGEDTVDVVLEFNEAQRTMVEQLGRGPYTREQMGSLFGALGGQIFDDAIAADGEITTHEGDDLNVGGEGMKAFYDRNLVNITNGLVKKAGAKVGPVKMALPAEAQVSQRAAQVARARGDEAQARVFEKLVANAANKSANHGFEITDALRDQASGGFPLFQKTDKPRGQIAMYTDKMVITLFEDADLSTLLHETGHLFVEELARNAQRPNAPADVKADWTAMKKWLKQNGHPVVKNVIPREAHELMARGFERYLMEGRAPSKNLEGVFGTFRAWLIRIYQNVQRLTSPINPEVREVFDRLL
ncbi:MAG: hypothetical protein ACRDAM_16970, partial [Casimicrobium sp.]